MHNSPSLNPSMRSTPLAILPGLTCLHFLHSFTHISFLLSTHSCLLVAYSSLRCTFTPSFTCTHVYSHYPRAGCCSSPVWVILPYLPSLCTSHILSHSPHTHSPLLFNPLSIQVRGLDGLPHIIRTHPPRRDCSRRTPPFVVLSLSYHILSCLILTITPHTHSPLLFNPFSTTLPGTWVGWSSTYY